MSREDEPVYLGAYWGDRPETVEACAGRLARCMTSLASLSPLLGGWRPKGRGRSVQSPVELGDFVELLEAGVNRRDFGGSVIPELGFEWSAWNGNTASAASVSVLCGASAARAGVLNSFVLRLPELVSEGADELYGAADALFSEVVEAWEPEWAVLTSHELRESIGLEPDQPTVGWLTYVGPGREVRELGDTFGPGGTLFRLGRVWAEVDASGVAAVARSLARAGALAPIGS